MQDNDNLEMMTHLEGSIVDSLYDMALISWSKELKPPLPCAIASATHATVSEGPINQHASQHHHIQPTTSVADLFQSLAERVGDPPSVYLPEHTEQDPHYDSDIAAEVQRALHVLAPRRSEKKIDAITRHLSKALHWSLAITRLTDSRYHDPARYQGDCARCGNT